MNITALRHVLVNTLRLFCIVVVVYEIYVGTNKYMSVPIASKIYSTEVDLPFISICQRFLDYRMANVKGWKLGFFRLERLTKAKSILTFGPDQMPNNPPTTKRLVEDIYNMGCCFYKIIPPSIIWSAIPIRRILFWHALYCIVKLSLSLNLSIFNSER